MHGRCWLGQGKRRYHLLDSYRRIGPNNSFSLQWFWGHGCKPASIANKNGALRRRFHVDLAIAQLLMSGAMLIEPPTACG